MRISDWSSDVCSSDLAFGFEPAFVLLDADGNLAHSEMEYGNSSIMVGNEWSDDHRSPANLGGKNTQTVHVQLGRGEDIDAHCETARAAGADIIAPPDTQFYGDRTYRARTPRDLSTAARRGGKERVSTWK